MTRSSRLAVLCVGAALALFALAVTVPAQAAVPATNGTLPICPTTPGVTPGGSDPHHWSPYGQQAGQQAMPAPTCVTAMPPKPTHVYTTKPRTMPPPTGRTTMPTPTMGGGMNGGMPTTGAPTTASAPTSAPMAAPVKAGNTSRLPVTGFALGGALVLGGVLLIAGMMLRSVRRRRFEPMEF